MSLNVKPETFSFLDLIKIRNNIESNGFEDVPGLEILKEYGVSIKGVQGFKVYIDNIKMEMMSNKNIPADELNMKFSMIMQLEGLYKDSQRVLTQFNVEIHKRIANPVSCQIFFFLSFPLGLVVKRSGKGMSFSLAIIFLFLYYAIFIFGSGISLKSNVPDWIGPWMANLTMGMISIYIMISRTDIQIKKTFPFNYINLAWKRLAIYTSKIKFYKKK